MFLNRSDGGLIVRIIDSAATNVCPQSTLVHENFSSRVRFVTGLLLLIMAVDPQYGHLVPTGLDIISYPGFFM